MHENPGLEWLFPPRKAATLKGSVHFGTGFAILMGGTTSELRNGVIQFASPYADILR